MVIRGAWPASPDGLTSHPIDGCHDGDQVEHDCYPDEESELFAREHTVQRSIPSQFQERVGVIVVGVVIVAVVAEIPFGSTTNPTDVVWENS